MSYYERTVGHTEKTVTKYGFSFRLNGLKKLCKHFFRVGFLLHYTIID